LTLDDIFRSIGQFGPFQRRVVFVVALVSFSTAFNNLGYVFWAARPSWSHCMPSVEDQLRLELDNITAPSSSCVEDVVDDCELLLNLTVPWDTDDGRAVRSR
jgi:hypothetical protein